MSEPSQHAIEAALDFDFNGGMHVALFTGRIQRATFLAKHGDKL